MTLAFVASVAANMTNINANLQINPHSVNKGQRAGKQKLMSKLHVPAFHMSF